MRKIIRNILPVFALAFILIMPGSKIMAGTIASIDTNVKDGTVTVSGTADSGVLSVAIFVYDEAGDNMLQMKSVAVDSEQKFSEDFSLGDGKYLVKAADYEGGKFVETTVTVGENKSDDTKLDDTKSEDSKPEDSKPDGTTSSDTTSTNTADTGTADANTATAAVNAAVQTSAVTAPQTGDDTMLFKYIAVAGTGVIFAVYALGKKYKEQ